MAWVEDQTIEWEQGIDGELTIEMFNDVGQTQAWPFPGWDVNSVLADYAQRKTYALTTTTDTLAGVVKVIAPENLLNSLKSSKKYWLNILMVAPGNIQADDHHLAFVPVTILKRSARRDL